jgi:gliding motility-associated-like protein
LTAGSYNVTIKDNNGCTTIVPVTITQPPVLSGSITSQTNVSCFGGNNGSVTVAGSGGTAPYQYSIDGVTYQASGTFGSLTAGSYTVTVKDNNGCTTSVPVIITEPTVLTMNSVVTDITCNGSPTGQIDITASGGTAPYQYSIDNGTTFSPTGTFTGLTANTYNLVVKDANNCTVTGSDTLTEPSLLTFDNIIYTNIICNSQHNGTITILTSGGVSPYQYSIDRGTTYIGNNFFNNLDTGKYYIYVKDTNNCTIDDSIQLSEPLPIHTSSSTVTAATCNKSNDGAISVTATGGSGTLSYAIDGGAFGPSGTFISLSGGNHIISVKDTSNCQLDTTILVPAPAPILINSTTSKNLTCFGLANGEIHVTSTGGTLVKYQLMNANTKVILIENKTSPDFFNLTTGFYQVIASDSIAGCDADTTLTIEIKQPAVLNIDQLKTNGYVCYGTNNGSIVFQQISGGTRPYQYSLDGTNWQSDSSFLNLMPAVTYNPMVKDSNNCTATAAPVTLLQANQMFIDSLEVADVTTCYNNPEGTIRVYARGGNGILQFSLDDFTFQPDSTFKNLTGGNYTVYVRDMLTNCEVTKDTVVKSPTQVVIDSVKHTNASGGSKGTITVYAKGGTGALEYSTDNSTYQPGNLFTNVDPGKYYIYVRDANGCMANKDSVFINSMTVSVTHTDINCKGQNTGTITATVFEPGTYLFSIDGGVTTQDSGKFVNLAASTYPVRVVNTSTLAQFDTTIVIAAPDTALSNISVLTSDPSCYNSNEGRIVVQATGKMPLQYSIDGGANYQLNNIFMTLGAGSYKVMVKDINSCKDSVQTVLNNPLPIRITAQITNVRGTNLGSIKITSVQNGSAPFKFALNHGAWNTTDSTFNGLSAGQDTITIQENLYNCRRDTILTVGTDANLNVLITPKDDSIKCYGDKKGEMVIDVIDTLATTPIRYRISGAITLDTTDLSGNKTIHLQNLSGGTYNITVTDATGLTANATEVLNRPPQLAIALDSISGPTCNYFNNNKNGFISVHASGGTGNYNYLWSNNSIDSVQTGLAEGRYIIVAFDANNCAIRDTFNLIAHHSLTVSAGVDLAACPGDGINLQGSGGSSDITDSIAYRWIPNNYLNDSTILTPFANPPSGIYNYKLRASINAGCIAIDSMILHIWPTYNFRIGIQQPSGQLSFDNPAIVRSGNPIQLEAVPDSLTNFQWTIADMTNILNIMDNPLSRTPIVTLTDSTRFYVTAITPEGCPVNTQIYLKIAGPLLIPSGFTPNGDGINDFWQIGNAEGYPDIQVEVYSRWGSKVYSSKGYNDSKHFDGTLHGKPLPMGTYYYIIQIPGYELFKGTVTIVR